MAVDIRYGAIDVWPRPRTKYTQCSRFKSSFSTTVSDLERELYQIDAKAATVCLDLSPGDIRLDGQLRAGIKPRSSAVLLVVEMRFNKPPRRFPCDSFDKWQDNLRAIALALEALRTIDRYGVTSAAGEQYRGFEALPAPNGDYWSKDQARDFLRSIIGNTIDLVSLADAIRECERRTHPDVGGDADKFKKVQQARKLLLTS